MYGSDCTCCELNGVPSEASATFITEAVASTFTTSVAPISILILSCSGVATSSVTLRVASENPCACTVIV